MIFKNKVIHSNLVNIKYDKQDQQIKAAFNARNPHMTQQQEPVARSPGGPQTKTGQGKDRARILISHKKDMLALNSKRIL
jgi:hypothetical protein